MFRNDVYIPTYLPTYTHLPTYLPIYTYLPSYLPNYLPTYLLTYLPTYLLTYLPTYLPTYRVYRIFNMIILMRTYTHGGLGTPTSSQHICFDSEKLSPIFSCAPDWAGRGSNLGSLDLESHALPIEPPRQSSINCPGPLLRQGIMTRPLSGPPEPAVTGSCEG